MDCKPCTSEETSRDSKKRKQPDGEGHLLEREGPLTTEPIENEYENLCDEDDASEDEEMPAIVTHLKRGEMKQIFEAQEPGTETKIDGIKVTPFNLSEELEEGEFDKAGNFVFRKRQNSGSEDENDTWAESVDWEEVERREAAATAAAKVQSAISSQKVPPTTEANAPRDKTSCYKTMLRLMKPDEVVKKTIQRLGDGIPKRKPVNRNKRAQISQSTALDQSSMEEKKRNLDLMIELAHQRLQDGDVDIYQKSYEDLEEAVNS